MFHITPLGLVIVTWGGWLRIALFLFVYAVLIMVGFAFVLRGLDNTKGARARRAREMPAEARAKIGELAEQVVDGYNRERVLREENVRLRGLVIEESNHGRNWRARAHEATRENIRG